MRDLRTNWSLKIDTRTRVVHDHFVTIKGRRFDAEDLMETLDAMVSDDIVLDEHHEGNQMMKTLGVIDSFGSNRHMLAATPGPNFNAFRDSLHAGLARARRAAREQR